MSRKKVPSPVAEQPTTGYSATAKVALQETAARVQEMHSALAASSFAMFNNMPLLGDSAQRVQQAHDALADGMYAAMHQAGGGLLEVAAALEKQQTTLETGGQPPGRLASDLRSAINGAFGEHLAGSHNALAIQMGLYRHGQPVPLACPALAEAWPENRQRLCLFIHGLLCNEHCWEAGPEAIDMPRQLEADSGYTALTLRYNSGLPIVENGAQLALLLEELLIAWPHPLKELVIIGHSMGGLLARSAFEQSMSGHFNWPALTRTVICLGSPNLGSAAETLSQLTATARRLTHPGETPAPIAALQPKPTPPDIAWRFIGGSLTEDPANPLGEIVGDGLITLGSATVHELQGDVQSVRLGAINHMGLLTDPRVYAQIRAWLGLA